MCQKKVLIIGGDGFIGNSLTRRLLCDGNYDVVSVDIKHERVADLFGTLGFTFVKADISNELEKVEELVSQSEIVFPLAAIPTPADYINNPLSVFELDFEANLRIIRLVFKYGKRLIFPSTSEVYGMCQDEFFDEENSQLVLGPIRNKRWIYSCSKQLLDRIIMAYGERGLDFTIFRPFNWIGPSLDSFEKSTKLQARVLTQMIYSLVTGSPIQLVDGGIQKRCFTDIDDGIECLFRIVENRDTLCAGKIINIGNPENEISIRELATLLVEYFLEHPLVSEFPPFAGIEDISSTIFYGNGYQDCSHRKPDISHAFEFCGWKPEKKLKESVRGILDNFLKRYSKC